jgi:hypothetical protein
VDFDICHAFHVHGNIKMNPGSEAMVSKSAVVSDHIVSNYGVV